MKTFLPIIVVAGVGASVALGQVLDTAKDAAKTTAETAKAAGETVAHGVKKAADKVGDALTPDADARRVDVSINDGNIDMPTALEPGKTAFVVKNDGTTSQNFEIKGRNIDRKFIAPPDPGETKVLHTTLRRGTYTIYSVKTGDGTHTKKATLTVK